MSVPEIISLLMFVLAGGTLASGGITITDKPVQFLIIMLCLVVVKVIGLTR